MAHANSIFLAEGEDHDSYAEEIGRAGRVQAPNGEYSFMVASPPLFTFSDMLFL